MKCRVHHWHRRAEVNSKFSMLACARRHYGIEHILATMKLAPAMTAPNTIRSVAIPLLADLKRRNKIITTANELN